MSEQLVKGLYEVKSHNKTEAILISVTNEDEPIKYDYYILTTNGPKKDPLVIRITNPIAIARDSQYHIHRIEKDNNRYVELVNHFTTSQVKGLYPKIYSPRLVKKPNKNRTVK